MLPWDSGRTAGAASAPQLVEAGQSQAKLRPTIGPGCTPGSICTWNLRPMRRLGATFVAFSADAKTFATSGRQRSSPPVIHDWALT